MQLHCFKAQVGTHTDTQTHRHTDTQTHRHTHSRGNQTAGQANTNTNKNITKQAHRGTHQKQRRGDEVVGQRTAQSRSAMALRWLQQGETATVKEGVSISSSVFLHMTLSARKQTCGQANDDGCGGHVCSHRSISASVMTVNFGFSRVTTATSISDGLKSIDTSVLRQLMASCTWGKACVCVCVCVCVRVCVQKGVGSSPPAQCHRSPGLGSS